MWQGGARRRPMLVDGAPLRLMPLTGITDCRDPSTALVPRYGRDDKQGADVPRYGRDDMDAPHAAVRDAAGRQSLPARTGLGCVRSLVVRKLTSLGMTVGSRRLPRLG